MEEAHVLRQARLARAIVEAATPLLDSEPAADRFDLANGLLAAGLWMAEEHIGLEAVAAHLTEVAKFWTEKVHRGEPGVRGAIN